jgi:plastocyanin
VGSVFSPRSASTSVGAKTTIVFNNQDADILHDFVLFSPSGTQLAATELASGPITQSVSFTPAAAGSYSFKCSVHPQQMRGAISVQ